MRTPTDDKFTVLREFKIRIDGQTTFIQAVKEHDSPPHVDVIHTETEFSLSLDQALKLADYLRESVTMLKARNRC